MSVKYFIQIHLWKLLVRRWIFETSISSNRYLLRLITYHMLFFFLFIFFVDLSSFYNHRSWSWQRFIILRIILHGTIWNKSTTSFNDNIFYSPKLSLTWIHIYLFIYKAGGRGNKTPQFKLFNVDLPYFVVINMDSIHIVLKQNNSL